MKNTIRYLTLTLYLYCSALGTSFIDVASAEEGHDDHKHEAQHAQKEGHKKHDTHDEHEDEDKHEHDDHDKHSDEHKDENKGEHKDEHGHEGHDDHEEEALKLSPEQQKEFDVVVESASSGILEQYVNVPGEVVVNQDTFSHISARFPGIVKQVKKRIGDRVEKDDALAVIESNESLTLYSIKSLISGTVIEKHATIGELLREEDVAYTVADLTTVWVNLSIYQADLPHVKPGQEVTISQGHGQHQVKGVISYLSPIIDEDTRTSTARIVLPNPDGIWTPGLFVTARIKTLQENVALRIPQSAIQNVENKTSVFVKTNGEFKATPVVLGRANDTFAEVLSGLKAGQQYVSKHSFTLKAELSKASFGDGHNH